MVRNASHSLRLQVEALEDREVPAIIFGVTTSNQLVTLDSANPSVILRQSQITGMVSKGEVITDIDVRPGTGALYGFSNFHRLYLLNAFSGFALPIGGQAPVVATGIGFDFDPRNDNVWIVSNRDENLILNPNNGALSRGGELLTYAPGDRFHGIAPRITGLAFANPVPSATTTGVVAIDHALGALVRPTSSLLNGQLSTIGRLGVSITANVGFDIAPVTGVAFASFQVVGQSFSQLFVVNLGNGHATSIGVIGPGLLLSGIAVDLRGISGFTSVAGFAALPPQLPPPVFSIPGLTSPLFPSMTQSVSGTLVSPLFSTNVTF